MRILLTDLYSVCSAEPPLQSPEYLWFIMKLFVTRLTKMQAVCQIIIQLIIRQNVFERNHLIFWCLKYVIPLKIYLSVFFGNRRVCFMFMLGTKLWECSQWGVRGLLGCLHLCSWGSWQGPGVSVSEDSPSPGCKGSLWSGIWSWGRPSSSSQTRPRDSAASSWIVLTTEGR